MPRTSGRLCVMRMIFKAFTKKLFGRKYERLTQMLFIHLIVFWGLSISGFRTRIAPPVLYLTVTAVTAGVMWQALSSKDINAQIQHMLMLPFGQRNFVFSYTAALGLYAILTKTVTVLAILLAVSSWGFIEIVSCSLCAMQAVLMASAIFCLRRRHAAILWAACVPAAIVCLWAHPWFMLLPAANSIVSFFLLWHADGYSFCLIEQKNRRNMAGRNHHSVWLYLFRYLRAHKNYLTNTVVLWCIACVLPLFFQQMDIAFVLPIGFAILSLNTPICILLSCDPASEQAVRFLPGQTKAFCVPYCLFIFLCNAIADMIFLCSMQIQIGGVTVPIIATAFLFALQSAVFSILLEWFFPIRGWKIESDLWHHPRKYLVPAVMLLAYIAASSI